MIKSQTPQGFKVVDPELGEIPLIEVTDTKREMEEKEDEVKALIKQRESE